jgi:predicted phosphate transport protein (TIGR00153 family)
MMKLDRIFGFMVPKDHKFFPLFNDAADNLVLASELLIKLVRESDLSQRHNYFLQIKEVENIGDDITRKLLGELNGTFITPFDREDIHQLICNMDDVVDYIHSSSKRINLYKLPSIPEEFVWIADRIHSANKEIQNVLRSVSTVNDFKNHTGSLEKIREFESEVDDIYQEFLSKLFDQEANAIDLIKKRDILTSLEKAIDKCDDVGNIFSTLIIKMG